MDEVEELCDRVAVIDRGKVVAIDSPAGLVGGEHQMRFTLMEGDPVGLELLPGVTGVSRQGNRVVVTGRGDFVTTVTAHLARHHVLVSDLRLDKRSLEDAFTALTGRSFG
jgi:ABC-2 type transport system ATP-binding protein